MIGATTLASPPYLLARAFSSASSPYLLARAYSSASSPCLLARAYSSASPNVNKEEKIVILGTGWGGYTAARLLADSPSLRSSKITVVSPSNHFLFTPLLPSSAVGTLEFRAIQEPVRSIKNINYFQAKAREVDFINQTILCDGMAWHADKDPDVFKVKYDRLIIAAGVKTNTFGTPNIDEREGKEIFFLKHLHHARAIRDRTIEMFEASALPGTSDNEKKRLLSFVVVGGGPTSCEYAAELHDFLAEDLQRLYPELVPFVKITLVEAGGALLGPFDKSLRDHVARLFKKRDITVKLDTAVKGVELYRDHEFRHEATQAVLSDGSKLSFGTMVWSAGLKPVRFTQQFSTEMKSKGGRILTDKFLRVKHEEGKVWAIGDCAEIEDAALPQLAQVAQQEANFVSKVLSGKQGMDETEFKFQSLGSMASLGLGEGIYDGNALAGPWLKFSGLLAWLAWRSAYWGKQVSWSNKILIPMYWFKTFVFGRDISRF